MLIPHTAMDFQQKELPTFQDLLTKDKMYNSELQEARKAPKPQFNIHTRGPEAQDLHIEEMVAKAKGQQKIKEALDKEHSELTQKIEKLNLQIRESNQTLEEYKKDFSKTKEELKDTLKVLNRAIKAYYVNTDMKVEVLPQDAEHLFEASVFVFASRNSRPANFTIDRQKRCIKGFQTDLLPSDEVAALKSQGLDPRIILSRLKNCAL